MIFQKLQTKYNLEINYDENVLLKIIEIRKICLRQGNFILLNLKIF